MRSSPFKMAGIVPVKLWVPSESAVGASPKNETIWPPIAVQVPSKPTMMLSYASVSQTLSEPRRMYSSPFFGFRYMTETWKSSRTSQSVSSISTT